MNARTVVAVLLGFIGLALSSSSVNAAPFVNLKMVIDGGVNDGASTIRIDHVGQVVNYRIVGAMAPIGTTNTSVVKIATITYGSSKPLTINSLVTGSDGFYSVRFSLRETGGFACSFAQVSIVGNFRNGLDASGGTAVANGIDYVIGAHGPADPRDINEVIIATGSFEVTALSTDGPSAVGVSSWGDPAGNVGGMNINNRLVVIAKATNADPFYSFAPLTLTPEPGTMIILAVGEVSAVLRRRRAGAGLARI